MNVVIVEDERETALNLARILKKIRSGISIVETIDSVDRALEYFTNNSEPDLIFMDVELSDGSCFEIFEEIELKTPIIFTTAYDQFISKSFEVNNLMYVVKPVDESVIGQCLNKFEKLYGNHTPFKLEVEKIKPKIKTRFLVKRGSKMVILKATEIDFIVKEEVVYAVSNGKKYIINFSLDDLAERLDAFQFFRINRQEIVNLNIIDSIEPYFGGRLYINHRSVLEKELIVSQRRRADFKEWIEND